MDSTQQTHGKLEVTDARLMDKKDQGPPHERRRGFKIYDRALATVTALGVVGGGIWALYTYRVQRDDEYAQRQREYLLQLHKEKKEIYQPLCSAVGKIVSARSLAEAQPSIDKFWELYFGEVHLVWQDRKDETPPTELLPLSRNLVQACQEAIALEKAYGIAADAASAASSGVQSNEPAGDAQN